MNYEKLAEDLIKAKQQAVIAGIRNAEDEGTCNFDTPVLIVKGCRKDKLEEVAKKAGVSIHKWEAGVYHISGQYLRGMGNLRTRIAETFTQVMRECGWNAYTYYVMD